jgi:hypothetical protein
VAAGTGLTQDADGLSHADTSSQASVDNTGATFVQDINLDGFGHVTGAASVTVTPSLIGAPQNDGTGATGTWGISISGNAANVTGTVAIANGGTGATTDSQARTNLGLAIGSNVQAWDANLDQIAALAPTADNFIVGNGTAWTLETPANALASLGVTATAAELNYVDGVTSAIQTQIDAKAALASPAFTGQASFADGTVAAPSITNTGDTDTGLYFPAANQVAVALGGVQKAIMNADETTFKTRFVVDSATSQLALVGNNYANGVAYLSMSADGVFEIAPLDSSFGIGSVRISADTTLGGALVETVYAITGTTPALNPSNGTIQTWTLTGASTPTSSLNAGESITLMIDDGTAYTITWTSVAVTWKTDSGSAPTLNTTGYTAIVLWKVGSVVYGARVGNA